MQASGTYLIFLLCTPYFRQQSGLFGVPLLPFCSQGCALLQGGVCWRGCCAATPAHTPLSDPHAGREHIAHNMQFRQTKKPCGSSTPGLTRERHSRYNYSDEERTPEGNNTMDYHNTKFEEAGQGNRVLRSLLGIP